MRIFEFKPNLPIFILFSIYLLVLVHQTNTVTASEEKDDIKGRHSRVSVQNGESVISLDKEELLKNDIVVSSSKSLVRKKKVKTYGVIIDPRDFEGLITLKNKLVKGFDQDKEVLIEVTAPSQESIDSAPETAWIEMSNGTRAIAQLVDSSIASREKKQVLLYRTPKELLNQITGSDVLPISLPLRQSTQGIVVPRSAVVWWKNKAWIYMQQNPGRFVRREIPSNVLVKEGWFVPKESLPEKVGIVTQGAQSLLSEEFASQISDEAEQ